MVFTTNIYSVIPIKMSRVVFIFVAKVQRKNDIYKRMSDFIEKMSNACVYEKKDVTLQHD